MTLDLNALVAQGESESLEFKETTGQRGDAAKAICAMLNCQGGYVLFGVTDRGEIRGQQVTARTQEDVDRELRRIEPPAFHAIEVVPVQEDRSVIVPRVTGSNQGPYTYDGRPYLRQGPQTLPIPRSRYEQALLECLHGTSVGRMMPCPRASASRTSTTRRSGESSTPPCSGGGCTTRTWTSRMGSPSSS